MLRRTICKQEQEKGRVHAKGQLIGGKKRHAEGAAQEQVDVDIRKRC